MSARAVIFGLEGPHLNEHERRFFAKTQPWGFILFARNLETPSQISTLCADLRASVGRDAPILIDQEGGRVARLRAPDWREWLPPLAQMDQIAPENRRQSMVLRYRLIAAELHALGIDVNCAPMVDLPKENAHEIILNRCYGRDVDQVAEMGRAVAEGLLAGGVLPIIKHIPGHGRATADSHFDLPMVDTSEARLQETDFEPFRRLSDLPMAMSAHIVYSDIDKSAPATTSAKMVGLIRNSIGFDGLLMTDDLSMKALRGSFGMRVDASISAGCDMMLHCNGDREEMAEIADHAPMLAGNALRRADAALSMRKTPQYFDERAAEASFKSLL